MRGDAEGTRENVDGADRDNTRSDAREAAPQRHARDGIPARAEAVAGLDAFQAEEQQEIDRHQGQHGGQRACARARSTAAP